MPDSLWYVAVLGNMPADEALSLAQNLNAAAYHHQARHQALNAAADDLRARLTQIEEQIRRVA